MSTKKENIPLSIIEYYDWVASQKFQNPEEHHKIVPRQEQDFLQDVVYPMFYKNNDQFRTRFPFPLVLKDYSAQTPKYVIDNNFFTIIFFSYDNWDDEKCWEVSVHIKDHDFCDEKVNEFKNWYLKHYDRLFAEMESMPKEFLYPKLSLCNEQVDDFCIEFWNKGKDFMLFKLFDLFRLF